MRSVLLLICCFRIIGAEIDLSLYEKSIYSENGEDGVFAKLFEQIDPSSRFCVEIGAYDGFTASNTFLLWLQGWKRILFDRRHDIERFNLKKEFINGDNVNQVFAQHAVPLDLDLLCIDLDYNDFYVWKALDPKYRPSVVLIQYNGSHPPNEDKVVKYRPFYVGDQTHYFGASILALFRLARSKGYSLIYAESHGRNLFFLRDDLIDSEIEFKNRNQVEKIYRPHFGYLEDDKNRIYVKSEELLR